MKLERKEYFDKVYGSWLGRCIGSALGAPLEFRPYAYIKWKHGEIKYFVKPIKSSVYNDDEMYEIVGLLALERQGISLTSEMIGKEWLRELYTMMYTAEKVAFNNMKRGVLPPDSGKEENNVYFDFIGAQMKGDIWGQVAPCPEVAAEYARIDGKVAHDGDGVFGEIFVAVLVSLGFKSQDMNENIKEALKYIPKNSQYARIVNLVRKLHSKYDNWRIALKKLLKHWKSIKWNLIHQSSFKRKLILLSPLSNVHVLPNAGIITLSLLYGNGDFEKSICLAAMCAMDTDCNCGNVGAILGTIGEKRIPKKWKNPLNDIFKTKTKSIEKIKISELAKRTCNVGEKIIKEKCSEIDLIGNY
ncbi:MAG: ADP-ribosylglycohydrolase family protein [Candidatus Helarchaeota archaeon]